MFENVLLLQTKKLLETMKTGSLPEDTYLAGGTAIALHLGHRRSQDLDFFTPTEFVEVQWEEKLKREFGFKLLQRDWQTITGVIGKTKFSLFGYKHKLIGPLDKVYATQMASLPDLAAMKLETVIGRGTKRDLIDIYFLAQKFSLSRLFDFYQEKYGNLSERELMIKKALVFFEEAEGDEMPDMLEKVSWQEIKEWLVSQVANLRASSKGGSASGRN